MNYLLHNNNLPKFRQDKCIETYSLGERYFTSTSNLASNSFLNCLEYEGLKATGMKDSKNVMNDLTN